MDTPMAPLLVAAFVALGAGGYFLVLGRRRIRAGRDFATSAQVATAEITDLRLKYPQRNRDHNDGFWVPVVRFPLPDGRLVEAEAMTGSNPPPGRVGQRVEVRYDPSDPARVNLARGLAQPRALGAIWLAAGAGLAAIGLLALGAWSLLVYVLRVPV
jgi:hypothetical protein